MTTEPAALAPLSSVTLLLERTASELARVETVGDARELVDRSAAIRDLARRAKAGVDVENRVTALRVKAEMRLAELVDEGQERGEIAKGGDNPIVRDSDNRMATLPDLGIDRQRLAEARTLARHFSPAVIDGAAADATERGSELSRTALLREARATEAADPLPMTDVHRAKFPHLALAELRVQLTESMYAVKPEKFSPDDWTDRIDQLRPEDLALVRMHIGVIHRWVDRWERLLDRPTFSVIGGPE